MIRKRSWCVLGFATLIVALAGCSSSPVSTAPGKTAASSDSSTATPSASATTSAAPSASATPSASGKPSTDAAAGPTVTPVPGYVYSPLPASLKQQVDGMDATGLVSSVVGRGVKNRAGKEVGAILLLQYNAKLTPRLDKTTPSLILEGAVKGARAFTPGKTTFTSHVLSGKEVRMVRSDKLSIAVSYKRGGVLIQVLGPNRAEVLKFTDAYLAAGAKG